LQGQNNILIPKWAIAPVKSVLLFLRTLLIANIQRRVFFAIGIDTEQDVNKKYVHTGEYRNIREGIPRLLDIFDDFKAKPAWLITPDVAQNCGDFFRKFAKKHEIGCHVHPEYFVGHVKGVKMEKTLSQFSYQDQLEMLQEAASIISQNVGVHPRSFRAGRFGVTKDTFRALESCGFNVDSSLTPFHNWRIGEADWGFHATLSPSTVSPYFIHIGSSDILEIPVTIVYPFGLFPASLRPSVSSGSDMINVIKMRAESRDNPLLLNMMFHSMELIDPNPYFASKKFLNNIRYVLEYAHERDFSFVTMNEFCCYLKSSLHSEY
jgi:peptidoglycan/xylan/chitin deacetylase (PgdA/CDA1 family)